MRRLLLALVTATTFGFTLTPAEPAAASIGQTGVFVGACAGEIDVTVSNKPSFTSLVPNLKASISVSGLPCAIASLDYSGLVPARIVVGLGNITPVTCEAGLLDGGSGQFYIDEPNSFFPDPLGITTALEFNAESA